MDELKERIEGMFSRAVDTEGWDFILPVRQDEVSVVLDFEDDTDEFRVKISLDSFQHLEEEELKG